MTDKRDTPSLVMQTLNKYRPPGWLLAMILGMVTVGIVGVLIFVWRMF